MKTVEVVEMSRYKKRKRYTRATSLHESGEKRLRSRNLSRWKLWDWNGAIELGAIGVKLKLTLKGHTSKKRKGHAGVGHTPLILMRAVTLLNILLQKSYWIKLNTCVLRTNRFYSDFSKLLILSMHTLSSIRFWQTYVSYPCIFNRVSNLCF